MPLFSPLHLKRGTSAERQQQIAREIEKRQGKSATYTVPLIGSDQQIAPELQHDVESFLSEFYCRGIFDRSREMRALLQQNPATVGTHYALLVPDVVSFDQFWSRYFFRCSQTTILQEIRIASEHEDDEPDRIAETTKAAGGDEGAPNSPAAVVERTASGSGGGFLKRQIERGLGVIRNHSGSSTDSDNQIYQAAIAEAEAEDKAAAASAAAAQRAEIFRSEEDTDFIETIVESDETGNDSCASEEDVMIGSTAAAPPSSPPPPPPPAVVSEEREEAAEEIGTPQPVAAGEKEAYFESSEHAEEVLDAILKEESAPVSAPDSPPEEEEQLVTEPF